MTFPAWTVHHIWMFQDAFFVVWWHTVHLWDHVDNAKNETLWSINVQLTKSPFLMFHHVVRDFMTMKGFLSTMQVLDFLSFTTLTKMWDIFSFALWWAWKLWKTADQLRTRTQKMCFWLFAFNCFNDKLLRQNNWQKARKQETEKLTKTTCADNHQERKAEEKAFASNWCIQNWAELWQQN